VLVFAIDTLFLWPGADRENRSFAPAALR
jgi:hypothetical protein